MIRTMTDPAVVRYRLLPGDWTVRGLLDRIATADPPYHALIDVGALVTGLTNFQVWGGGVAMTAHAAAPPSPQGTSEGNTRKAEGGAQICLTTV